MKMNGPPMPPSVYRGRKKVLTPNQAAELQKSVVAGQAKTKLAQKYGDSRETLYQNLRED